MDPETVWNTHRKNLLKDQSFLDEDIHGKYQYVMKSMRNEHQYFSWFHRLSPKQFDRLVVMIKEDLTATPLSPELSLSLALRYLSSYYDDTYRLLLDLAEPVYNDIVFEVFRSIIKVLKPVSVPNLSENGLAQLVHGFHSSRKIPNCVGALDVRRILCEERLGDRHIKIYELPFAAISDAKFRFIHTPLVMNYEDGGLTNLENFPVFEIMNNFNVKGCPEFKMDFPPIILGAPNFPLPDQIMRPYNTTTLRTEKIYNTLHNFARRAIDNALGMLFLRWEIFRSYVIGDVTRVSNILECAVVLHNWLTNEDQPFNQSLFEMTFKPKNILLRKDDHGKNIEGYWPKFSITQGVMPIKYPSEVTESKRGNDIRSKLTEYFKQFDHLFPAH